MKQFSTNAKKCCSAVAKNVSDSETPVKKAKVTRDVPTQMCQNSC